LGLVKVKCLDGLNGTWRGQHTGHQYRFTDIIRECWVDKRDMPYLLTWKGPNGEQIFERVT